jgi:hypothetical protein
MEQAAPQAAGGMTAAEIAQALDVLRALWDDEYLIGCDERGWWAERRGRARHDRGRPGGAGPADRR